MQLRVLEWVMRRTAIAINPPINPIAGKDQTINPVSEPQAVPQAALAGNPPAADLAVATVADQAAVHLALVILAAVIPS
jgi:hypothetical protein